MSFFDALEFAAAIRRGTLHPATRAAREGFLWSSGVNFNGTPVAGTDSSPTILSWDGALPIGQSLYTSGISFGANRACQIRIQLAIPNNLAFGVTLGNFANGEYSFYYTPGQTSFFPLKMMLWGGVFPFMVSAFETGNTPLIAWGSWSGYRVSDDALFEASKVILNIGDSILGAGPPADSPRTSLAWFQVRDYLRSQGKDYRAAVKQLGGTRTDHAEYWRANGYLDLPDVDLIRYQMGANDCSQGISPAVYEANWAAFVPWALTRWPGVRILMLGPTPAENNTTETNMVAYRSNLSTFVAGLNNPQVKYLNLGASFDRTDTTNYSTSDPTGSHIHPSIKGNAAIFTNAEKPFIDANLNWF